MLCVLCIAARDINKSVSMAERLCECNKKKKKVRRRKTWMGGGVGEERWPGRDTRSCASSTYRQRCEGEMRRLARRWCRQRPVSRRPNRERHLDWNRVLANKTWTWRRLLLLHRRRRRRLPDGGGGGGDGGGEGRCPFRACATGRRGAAATLPTWPACWSQFVEKQLVDQPLFFLSHSYLIIDISFFLSLSV